MISDRALVRLELRSMPRASLTSKGSSASVRHWHWRACRSMRLVSVRQTLRRKLELH